MRLKGLTIGVGFTGSFCTYDKIFIELENLVKEGANVHTIFSDVSQNIDCRFGNSEEFMKKAYELTGNKPIVTIEEAEPFGPKGIADIIIIAPCTGNTAAKLANGITDSPVLMAAKGHLRNDKPLVISISTNDALSFNFKNIGILLNSKNIYFVPFGQDNCKAKPNSMIAHTELIVPTIELALENKQLQPVINSPHQ
ncbi:dipicolinate synthase subunit B [Clostridioides sp. ES-S-0108-01]|uniref:dipicolinate synthase subunit B n=1 Tax=unclassified Clostridioides TaxID=2635829 RepID=UPI001D0C80B1|nr:dipicolinate synthase subunit B [Clostridioides sp. ES-S-0171-01]MCC0688959.1 dipicolinate synthase subunit B [Clostridioides sp. ES-S-0056-01]MCC0716443.1 dipicolinate synthase subunit B [Clostridioides sp. ES-S-0077-01]MCC0783409.1 dipicolinate synthase subunit B [Clostridioides sp. ES-S-0108-01]UDN50552.1 dipicolinate synthase subunit B [Clostridioides sp. ES-S-0107-01]UDN54025.1 dipicolinate synthase subunit B [Clostridioides sp. ES-S-0054-01]